MGALSGGSTYLFPACAGVILGGRKMSRHKITFPRVCGGDPKELSEALGLNVFSPRVRG